MPGHAAVVPSPASSPTLQSAYRSKPISNAAAWEKWEELIDLPQVVFAAEPDDLTDGWRQFAARNTASPKVWMDAYLAAFAISGRLDFVTLDRDFRSYQKHGLQLPPARAAIHRMTTDSIISKVWSFCHTLRDNGVGYGDYLEQLHLPHLSQDGG